MSRGVLGLLSKFNQMYCGNPNVRIWSTYIDMVKILLDFIRPGRDDNCLEAYTVMLPWLTVYDHTNYAWWGFVYLLDMKLLEKTPWLVPALVKTFGYYANVFMNIGRNHFRSHSTTVNVVCDWYTGQHESMQWPAQRLVGKKNPNSKPINERNMPLPQVWKKFIALIEIRDQGEAKLNFKETSYSRCVSRAGHLWCKSKCRTAQWSWFKNNLNCTYVCGCEGLDCCNPCFNIRYLYNVIWIFPCQYSAQVYDNTNNLFG